ncbi:Iron-containing alcohol dehydrogenase [Desulfotomaculum arcticum]|uniref:Iron-containing alcohol dehydrogenase n=1 Tax=Desulfotruncus arcticus DSM 17038 TaxID=1121424 RepID=A0A1I2RGS8_9FIRM|nr:iron-containing alcohol dehydrogenase [Desulfotruncus arcticus]SFG37837.1 Iron-containing alcohol dehydrogenase [Desulfotomaculum arcticum] [Desulfotruncus arcticus DSM 17038]
MSCEMSNYHKPFNMNAPEKIIFGNGTAGQVGELVKGMGGKSILVVADPVVAKIEAGQSVIETLKAAGLKVSLFDQVEMEPCFESVASGVNLGRSCGADVVVGVGGGSALDSAKGISAMINNDGNLKDYVGIGLIPRPALPLVLLPTTAGTGSEVTNIAIFTNKESGVKSGVVSDYIRARVAVVDPGLTVGLPAKPTAYSGMDALCHAVEAYTSVNANPLSDMYALEAIRLVTENLRTAVFQGVNVEARTGMAAASLYAGIAFGNAGVTAVHALAYPLGARYHVPHGLANAILLPAVMRHNLPGNLERFAVVADVISAGAAAEMVRDKALLGVEEVAALSADVGIPSRLRDLSVKEEDLAAMADEASHISRLLANNPRPMDSEAIRVVYEACY